MNDDVLIRRQGSAGRITLNRPKAINALTASMVTVITHALDEWVADPGITHVVLDGAGDRGLCAGGDVLSLYESRTQGSEFARSFWSHEYRLNSKIKRYPKPFVALMDGVVMGGGIGLAGHASHRIVTERSMLAMPETGIGLIPDVGGTWLLARAPGEVGTYLALTGSRMIGADAIFAGFADHFVAAGQLPTLIEALTEVAPGGVDQAISTVSTEPPASALASLQPQIDAVFCGRDVRGIMVALQHLPSDWAANTWKGLQTKSPKALCLTLAALRQAAFLPDLDAALVVEYRLVTRLFEDGEFVEGVRALLVDKDKAPKWQPTILDQVAVDLVAAYLGPLANRLDLVLAS